MEISRSRPRTACLFVSMVNPVTMPRPLWRDIHNQIAEGRYDFRSQCTWHHQRIQKLGIAAVVRQSRTAVEPEVLRRRVSERAREESRRDTVSPAPKVELRCCRLGG